jgi:flavin-dependent dehydrogenase
VLLAGDAAGQVKATTGGGIVFGAAAARIAAECIAAGRAKEYEARWRAALWEDLELHQKLRRFFNSLPDERMESLFAAAKLLRLESFLNRFGDMDKPSKMVEQLKKDDYAPLYAVYSMLIK